MADLKKKTTTNESLNSHWLPANVAGRLTVLPANCKIHPRLARGRVLISGPVYVCTKSFLKTTTNSSCVCAHLANKADSDSDSEL